METTARKKQTAFRLSEALLAEINIRAMQSNRSVNNYVESILSQSVFGTPNPDTIEAIKESRSGKYAGKLDMQDFDSFLKSVDAL